jgi:hypothetical protein
MSRICPTCKVTYKEHDDLQFCLNDGTKLYRIPSDGIPTDPIFGASEISRAKSAREARETAEEEVTIQRGETFASVADLLKTIVGIVQPTGSMTVWPNFDPFALAGIQRILRNEKPEFSEVWLTVTDNGGHMFPIKTTVVLTSSSVVVIRSERIFEMVPLHELKAVRSDPSGIQALTHSLETHKIPIAGHEESDILLSILTMYIDSRHKVERKKAFI